MDVCKAANSLSSLICSAELSIFGVETPACGEGAGDRS